MRIENSVIFPLTFLKMVAAQPSPPSCKNIFKKNSQASRLHAQTSWLGVNFFVNWLQLVNGSTTTTSSSLVLQLATTTRVLDLLGGFQKLPPWDGWLVLVRFWLNGFT